MANLYQLSTFTNTPDNGPANDLWNISYRAIFRANEILENLDKVTALDAQKKKQYIAELHNREIKNIILLGIAFYGKEFILAQKVIN